jgi:putative FmdB family regulatory protein
MPTYEYRCSRGHTFELFQKMSDPPAAECPECGSPAERVVSGGAGFVFKGAGFYITDYRSEDYRKKAQTENPAGETKPSAAGGSGEKSAKKAKGDQPEKKAPSPPAPKKASGGDE